MRRIIVNTSIILVLMVLTLLVGIQDVSALACNVPSTYPDVATAVANGCRNIVFDGDVTEASSFTVTGNLSINGNGYRWILINNAGFKAVFERGAILFRDLNISVAAQYTDVFIFRDSYITLENVDIYIFETYVTIFRYDPVNTRDNILSISNLYVKELTGRWFRWIFRLDSSPGFGVDVSIWGFTVEGIQGPSFMVPAAIWLDSYAGGQVLMNGMNLNNSSILIRSRPGSANPLEVVISGLRMNVTGIPPYVFSSYVSYVQFFIESSMYIDIRDVYAVSLGNYDVFIYFLSDYSGGYSQLIGENMYINSGGRGALFISHGGFFNSLVRLSRVTFVGVHTIYADSWRALEISNSTILVDRFSFTIFNPFGLNTYYVIEDMILDVEYSNGVITHGMIYLQDFWQLNSTIRFRMYNVTVYSNFFGAFRVINFFPGTRVYVDLERVYMYPVSPLPFYYSIFIFQTVSSEYLELNIRYSIIGRFILIPLSGFSGLLYETVFQDNRSFSYKPLNVSWTLEILVESVDTGYPVAGVDVGFYEGSTLLAMVETNSYGISMYRFSYVFPAFNFFFSYVNRILYSINESYFQDIWAYNESDNMTVFKYPSLVPPGYSLASYYTLPSWFGRIVIQFDPLLEMYGIGYIEHRPITIVFRGDLGYIGLYKDVDDIVLPYLNVTSWGPPLMVIPLMVTDVKDYGSYVIIETLILYEGMWLEQVFVYNTGSGILYSTGPLEIVAKVTRY